jgi:rhamnulokinase
VLRVLAVDLGASSARVALVEFGGPEPRIEVVHRYVHEPLRDCAGALRWDWRRLVAEVEKGLELGLRRGSIASIGVDTWGVDYGLVDERGELLSLPYSYRDTRTDGWRKVVERIGAEHLYAISGIQLMAINTIFQLAVHERAELAAAHRLLMLPELMVCALTGTLTGERTSAGTTALVDVRNGDWSKELIRAIEVDPAIFPEIAQPPQRAGRWRGVPVHLVAGHDTASAVAALPGPRQPGAAFISSGTWMLVGAERPQADTSEAARRANFSNEPAAVGGVRFLKNVIGLAMLERCRTAWGSPPIGEIVEAASKVASGGPVIDAMDPRFLDPDDVEHEVREASGLLPTAGRAEVARCILDSLAASAVQVIEELASLLGAPIPEVCIVGGGSQNRLLNRLIEQRSGLPVRTGSPEATALGNGLLQAVALGYFGDLDEARLELAGPGDPPDR